MEGHETITEPFSLKFEISSHYADLAVLELTENCLLRVGIKGVHHHTQPDQFI